MRTDRLGWSGRLPKALYSLATRLVPVPCVDVLPYQVLDEDVVQIGLIQRLDAHGQVAWNMVGGGIHRRESVAEAAARHIRETLGPDVTWDDSCFSNPITVGEYFPVRCAASGYDPRKHAIAPTYAVPISGEVSTGGEAISFRWFSEDDLPLDAVGFGQANVIRHMLPLMGREGLEPSTDGL